MLNRIQIQEFRCLRDVDVPLKLLTVLIEPNNTGKSAFLSAIQLLATDTSMQQHLVSVADLWAFEPNSLPTIVARTDDGAEIRVDRGPLKSPVQGRLQWVASGRKSGVACDAQPVDTERLKLFLNEFMLPEAWLNQDESGLVEKKL